MRYRAQILSLIKEYNEEQIYNTLCDNEEHRVLFFNQLKRKGEVYFGGVNVYYETKTAIKDRILFKEWAITVIQNIKERRIQEINQMMYINQVFNFIFREKEECIL